MLPPSDTELAWMALADLGRRGTARWYDLARCLGSPRAVFTAASTELAAAGLTARGIAACREYAGWSELGRRRERCRALGIELSMIGDGGYPGLLAEIPDPPLVLYYRGRAPAELGACVAIVGSRRASGYGCRTAQRIARAVAAQGVTVISGLAVGIDAAAHEGALATGCSAAVMAGGLDTIYPARHRDLAERLVETGSLISEYPPGIAPLGHHFPIRNRIITGTARVTVVVEATERSGSLVSARLAAEQGREVLVVPGNVDAPTSRGTNALLRDGCAPLLETADVFAELGIETRGAAAGEAGRREKALQKKGVSDPEAARVLAVLQCEAMHVDDVAEACGLDEALVLEKLTALELDGLAHRLGGGTYALRNS